MCQNRAHGENSHRIIASWLFSRIGRLETITGAYALGSAEAETSEYETPFPAHVTLKVYNALGEEVAQLADRVVDEGLHYALFNGLRMPSGVYFCQLRAGSFVQTQKLLLVR